jgi:hypothetical protein
MMVCSTPSYSYRGRSELFTADSGLGSVLSKCQDEPDGISVPAHQMRPASLSPGDRRGTDRPARWLAVSMAALGVLAAASAVVSYAAQYRMVYAAKRVALAAALEAGIPDVAALIFAALGIALALHGKRAIRPRILNVCAVATSVAMNLLAAGHGWRDLAIWAMPPVAYALASDTAIGVVRAWTIARQGALNEALADDGSSPLALVGGLMLWTLRLAVAPVSTLSGFRSWVIDECPVAPGRRAVAAVPLTPPQMTSAPRSAITHRSAQGTSRSDVGAVTKTQRFLNLVIDRYGPLDEFQIANVSKVCSELAPEVDLNTGAARTALRRYVQAAQNGSSS